MQEKWNKIWQSIEDTDSAMEEFLNGGLSSSVAKQIQKLIKAWNSLKKISEDFDKYIAPVEEIQNSLPWETTYFAEQWQFWKEYLQEQHGQIMRSRSEKMALKYLAQLAGDNEEIACKIIEFSCYIRAKSFILPPAKIEDNNKHLKISTDGSFE